MSKIIDRTFDATKGILKTVFLGMPNLFTTSDVNRQISAFRSNLDDIEDTLGCLSDLTLSIEVTDSLTTCKVKSVGYIKCRGCSLPLPESSTYTVEAGPDTECFFCVSGTYKVVDYASDSAHEIAGAVFEDGTTMPAANQEILTDIEYLLTENPDILTDVRDEGKFCFILAKILTKSGSSSVIKPNYRPLGSSAMLDSLDTLEYIEQYQEDVALEIGDDFNACVNKLLYMNEDVRKRLSTRFKTLHNTWQEGLQGSLPISYMVKDGLLHIMCLTDSEVITGSGSIRYALDFDSITGNYLLSKFNEGKILVTTQVTVNGNNIRGAFIPLSTMSVLRVNDPDNANENYKEGIFGNGRIGLWFSMDQSGTATDVAIASVVDSCVFIGVTGGITYAYTEGPVDLFQLNKATASYPGFVATIPILA